MSASAEAPGKQASHQYGSEFGDIQGPHSTQAFQLRSNNPWQPATPIALISIMAEKQAIRFAG
jgi:hypothetical protein